MSHGDCASSAREGLFSRLGDEAGHYTKDGGAEAQQFESRLHRSVGVNFSKVMYGDYPFQPRTNVETVVRNGLCLVLGSTNNPSTEQRALDAIGECVLQELEKRSSEIFTLRDQLGEARRLADSDRKYFETELKHEQNRTLTEHEGKMSYWNQRDHCRAQLDSIMDIMLEPQADRIDFDALPLVLAHVLVTCWPAAVRERAMEYIEQNNKDAQPDKSDEAPVLERAANSPARETD